MDKKFIIRAIGWTIFACLVPVAFICWRYGIFHKAGSIKFSGLTLVSIIVLFFFARALIGYIRAGLVGWSMFKQVLNGVIKVLIPIATVLLIANSMRNSLNYFVQALCVVLVSEAIAIPINPFPEWLAKRQSEMKLEEQEGMLEAMWNKYFTKKKEEEKDGKAE